MFKRKAITVLTLSVIMSAAIGDIAQYNNVYAASDNKVAVYLEQDLVTKENATLVLSQKSGKNDVTLALELSEDYDKSITSFELSIQLDQSKIKNVSLVWNKDFTLNNCRYTYDQKTGELRLYVVDNKDLLNDRKITIGNMSIESDETSKFNSSLVLQELKTIDLQHNSDVVTVDRTEHTIVYTPSTLPPTKPVTPTPPITPTPITPTPTPSDIKVQGIKLNITKATLEVGKTLNLKATVEPWNASNTSVTWTSSNTKVAKVSANGKVTAVGKGTAKITARSKDGTNIKATAVITVKGKTVKATSIKLSKTSVVLKPKTSTTLKATISPSKATNKSVEWISSNPKVATVKNGKIVAKSVGTTTITVKTKDGSNLKASCKVTVANIKLNKTKATLKKGKSLSLKAIVSGKSKKVTWKSSNSKIATVSKTGKVTAKKAGAATITAKANGVTATFKITVK